MLAGRDWRVYAGVRTENAADELRAADGSAMVVPPDRVLDRLVAYMIKLPSEFTTPAVRASSAR